MNTILPPGYPLRPVNGGPLPKAQPKRGKYRWEPKVNGWRAWTHTESSLMFNRHNEPLSITKEFRPVLDRIRDARLALKWLDTEAFERRHPLGRGSLIILDFAPTDPFPAGVTLDERLQIQHEILQNIAQPWAFLHEPPPENELLYFAYTFTDYGIPVPQSEQDWLADQGHYQGEDVDGIHTAWRQLQEVNRLLGAEVFEGLVAKRLDSRYPLQSHSSDQEFPFWTKHRWRF